MYQLKQYISSYNTTGQHNINSLDMMISTIQDCGPVAIKFSQWITPKLEIMHNERHNETRDKPIWLSKFELLYEDCRVHDIQHTYQEYQNIFNESFTENYKIIDILGSGSIGQVYLIEDMEHTKFVMKVLHPNVKSDLVFFRRFFNFMTWLPYVNNKIKSQLPFDINHFISNFKEQSNFINEGNNLIKFYHYYQSNELIIIPQLYKVSESILIMSYEEGTPFDETSLNNYQKFKIVNLLNTFIRNNWTILNFNHGDLHKGNWKVIEGQNPKLIVYDLGFCFQLQQDKIHMIELITDTFEQSDKNAQNVNITPICEIIYNIVIYHKNDIIEFKERIHLYVSSKIIEFRVWEMTPVTLIKLIMNFAIQEHILINHVLIQFLIISIQCQSLLAEFGLKSSSKKEINSYTVFRERYLDVITFCKTYNIFDDYSKYLEDKLNKNKPDIIGVFDTIEFGDDIKNLALLD